MAYNHEYPYVDPNRYNSDWILNKVKELEGEMSTFEALNKITFDGEWDISKQYPAWCIVNTNGGTEGYISLKPVPAGVTINNTEYWSSVVNYTATIADLQNRVVALEYEVAHVLDKKYIFIGDSYGERSSFLFDVWSEIVPENMMGLVDGTDYWWRCVSGAGFSSGYKFQTALTWLATNTISDDDKLKITDIYVFGGVNDYNVARATIESDIALFVSYAKTTFPNAQVHIGHISSNGDATVQYKMHENTLPAYSSCAKYGASYVPLQDVLCNLDYLGSDLSHPTADGQMVLSQAIYNAIHGETVFTKNAVTRTFVAASGVANLWPDENVSFREYEENGIYGAWFIGPWLQVAFSSPVTIPIATELDLITMDPDHGVFPKSGYKYLGVPVRLKISGSYENHPRTLTLKLDFVNNKIAIKSDFASIANVDALIIYPFEVMNATLGDW